MSTDSTSELQTVLRRLRNEKKFAEEEFYPGAPTEAIRLRCEARVNRFLDEVLVVLGRAGKKEEVARRASALESTFEEEDTDEREKVGDYIGEVDRLLNA